MIILAVYYTLADIVLLGQCFYYRGFSVRDELSSSPSPEPGPGTTGALRNTGNGTEPVATERTALLPKAESNGAVDDQHAAGNGEQRTENRTRPAVSTVPGQGRRRSSSSFRDILYSNVDGTHLSPATPFIEPDSETAPPRSRRRQTSTLQAILFNTTGIALVCAAGFLGWYVSPGSKGPSPEPEPLTMDPMGQVFGYLCAVLYLGSRLPQLLLNYRRKSTDGVSLLFFLFACIGNLTYVLSILAYSPVCQGQVSGNDESSAVVHRHRPQCRPGEVGALYWRYILVNLSWLIGSFGTLLLDMAIFVQFFLYRDAQKVDGEDDGCEY